MGTMGLETEWIGRVTVTSLPRLAQNSRICFLQVLGLLKEQSIRVVLVVETKNKWTGPQQSGLVCYDTHPSFQVDKGKERLLKKFGWMFWLADFGLRGCRVRERKAD